MKIEPTDELKQLAKFISDEDNNKYSPLYNEIWYYQKKDSCNYYVHDIVDNIGFVKEHKYISDAADTLNKMIQYLDEKHDGYITQNWQKHETE